MLVSGSYSFFTPEGELVEMQYTADENGMTMTFVKPLVPKPPRPNPDQVLTIS